MNSILTGRSMILALCHREVAIFVIRDFSCLSQHPSAEHWQQGGGKNAALEEGIIEADDYCLWACWTGLYGVERKTFENSQGFPGSSKVQGCSQCWTFWSIRQMCFLPDIFPKLNRDKNHSSGSSLRVKVTPVLWEVVFSNDTNKFTLQNPNKKLANDWEQVDFAVIWVVWISFFVFINSDDNCISEDLWKFTLASAAEKKLMEFVREYKAVVIAYFRVAGWYRCLEIILFSIAQSSFLFLRKWVVHKVPSCLVCDQSCWRWSLGQYNLCWSEC